MSMPTCVYKLERWSKSLAETFRGVTHHGQAAASFRTIGSECCDDSMSSGFHASFKTPNVCNSVAMVGKEVERRPIMPDVVSLLWLPNSGVRFDPTYLMSPAAKACLCGLERRRREVEHGNIFDAFDEMIHKA